MRQYKKKTRFIAYGAETGKVETTGALEVFGLTPGDYFLYVSRMEPENNALLVVKAFERTNVNKQLVMVGDAPYAKAYIRQVRASQDPRILFTGGVYGKGYQELQSHCFAYIHATEVGGSHPALIEALGRGCCVLYLDTPENREVAAQAGIPYRKDEAELAAAIQALAKTTPDQRARMEEASLGLAFQRYDWGRIADEYLDLFFELLDQKQSRPFPAS
jgi:glycosyltransferase involved in cell wall biosynthesis